MDDESINDVTSSLESIYWQRQPRPYVKGDGFCIGATLDYRGPQVGHCSTKEQRAATIVINRAIKKLRLKGFHWSSLQFNRNTVSDPHIDKNNEGVSAVLILGDHTGGSLCVPSMSFKTPPGQAGTVAIIDGRVLHHSEKFQGTRYSIVAFVHNSWKRLPEADLSRLRSLGFQLPQRRDTPITTTPVQAPCILYEFRSLQHEYQISFSNFPHRLVQFVNSAIVSKDNDALMAIFKAGKGNALSAWVSPPPTLCPRFSPIS